MKTYRSTAPMKPYRSAKAARMIRQTYDALLATWDTPLAERDLPSPFGTTHVIAAGDPAAPPVLLLHGVGDDSALMWCYNAKALAAKFRLYAVDTLGGPGKSIPGPGYAKGFDSAQWLDATLDTLGLSAVSIVGTSHGAYLAQAYAAARPARVRQLVCIAGTVPTADENPIKTMMRIFLPEALFPTEKNTARLLRKLSGDHPEVFLSNPAIMTHYQWLLRGFSPMAMRHHDISPLTPAQIDSLRPKALYLAGRRDPFQRLGGEAALLASGMPCRIFDTAGHGLNHELAQDINQILLDVLR